jgi:hypothetical protein
MNRLVKWKPCFSGVKASLSMGTLLSVVEPWSIGETKTGTGKRCNGIEDARG